MYLPSFPEILAVGRSRGRDSEAPRLWNGLVGAWPLQEGGGATAWDVSGHGKNGTLSGGATWTVGDRGRALAFDGTDGLLTTGWTVPSSGPMSISVCLSSAPTSTFDYLFGISDDSGQDRFFVATSDPASGITTNGKFDGVAGWNIGTGTAGADSLITLTVNEVTGGTVRLLIDGSLVGSDASSGDMSGLVAGLAFGNAGAIAGKYSAVTLLFAIVHSRELETSELVELSADPWAWARLRRRVFAAAVAGGLSIPIAMHHYKQLMGAN